MILHGPHPSAGGGVLAFCDTLERALREHGGVRPRRWFIGAATGDGTTAAGAVAGVRAMLASVPALISMAGKGRVVHLNTSFTQKALVRDAVYARLARARRSRLVVQFHGGLPEHTTDAMSRRALRTLCAADALVVINDEQARELAELHPGAAGRIERIANSVELPSLDLRERIPARQDVLRLLFLSRLDPRKGILETIEALATTRTEGLDVHLDVAGDGPALDDAKTLAGRLSLADAVTFHGTVGGEAKTRLFREASAFMFPSYYPEGQPIAVLEAFAWGLPVIAAAVEPVASLVPDGRSGIHVPPRDAPAIAAALRRLFADRAGYAAIAEGNRRRAEEEFDAETAVTRFVAIYRRLLAA